MLDAIDVVSLWDEAVMHGCCERMGSTPISELYYYRPCQVSQDVHYRKNHTVRTSSVSPSRTASELECL